MTIPALTLVDLCPLCQAATPMEGRTHCLPCESELATDREEERKLQDAEAMQRYLDRLRDLPELKGNILGPRGRQ